ncbi:MAG: carboxymuconolactone decarboxylase family protein [Thermodesulfobacteriota bacterium]|jgi:AhpD family alkylhydroperoxidase
MSTEELPPIYQRLKAQHPDYLAAVEKLGATVREAGPIDEKTGHLIQLAAAASNRSEGSVHSHVRRALAAGASEAEIRHALLLLTSTIGFPTVAAALSWADDILKQG